MAKRKEYVVINKLWGDVQGPVSKRDAMSFATDCLAELAYDGVRGKESDASIKKAMRDVVIIEVSESSLDLSSLQEKVLKDAHKDVEKDSKEEEKARQAHAKSIEQQEREQLEQLADKYGFELY